MRFRYQDQTARVLLALGLVTRLDANETMVFSRQLEHVKTELVETEFTELKALRYIPLASGIDPGADTFTWHEITPVGRAKMVANYADDLPDVSLYMTENKSAIESHGASYSYSIQDLRRAAMAGVPLEARKGRAARESIARRIDTVLANGDAKRNVPGFLTNSSVPLLTSGVNGSWASASAADILEDLRTLEFAVWVQTAQTHSANSILLPTQAYQIAASTPYSTQVPDTILEVFLRSSTFVKSVEPWAELDTADAAGTGPRAVAYKRDPDVLEGVIPVEFEQLPPQAQSLAFVVPCHGRIGGTVVYKPYAIVFCDTLL